MKEVMDLHATLRIKFLALAKACDTICKYIFIRQHAEILGLLCPAVQQQGTCDRYLSSGPKTFVGKSRLRP